MRDSRVEVSLHAAVGIIVLAILGVLLGLSYVWRSQPEVVGTTTTASPSASRLETSGAARLPPSSTPTGGTAAVPGETGGPAGRVLVHVAGRVRKAGVVALPRGARVLDAVRAAGGLAAGADPAALNLARQVTDGEQVVVPVAGAPVGPATTTPSGPGAHASAAGAVNLNSATSEQLQTLPGVGPVLAQRILDWRQEHGRFSSVDELHEVAGIGERKYEEIAARVRV